MKTVKTLQNTSQPMTGKKIPIHENFYTWQGEGVHMGKSAYFIRTFGCPVHCPWCDSAGTWHKDYVPKDIEKFTAVELADMAAEHSPDFVVVTGGEPAIHDLNELTTELHDRDLVVHLETSGAFEIKGQFDWVTLSPKEMKMPLKENLRSADEIKIIVDSKDAIDYWVDKIGSLVKSDHIWLHPEWSQRSDPNIINAITEWVKKHGSPYRAGYQLHKIFKADSLDERSRPIVPLGGNEKLGY